MPYIQHLVEAMTSNCKSAASLLYKRLQLVMRQLGIQVMSFQCNMCGCEACHIYISAKLAWPVWPSMSESIMALGDTVTASMMLTLAIYSITFVSL